MGSGEQDYYSNFPLQKSLSRGCSLDNHKAEECNKKEAESLWVEKKEKYIP